VPADTLSWFALTQERVAGQLRDRREILQHIERQRIERRHHHVGAEVSDQHRIAVGRRACDPANPEHAGGTGHIFDHQRLPERHPHALAHDADQRIGRAAGRKRHHDGDRARRKSLRAGTCGSGQREGEGGECSQLAHARSNASGVKEYSSRARMRFLRVSSKTVIRGR
jgi:hypothetical protein